MPRAAARRERCFRYFEIPWRQKAARPPAPSAAQRRRAAAYAATPALPQQPRWKVLPRRCVAGSAYAFCPGGADAATACVTAQRCRGVRPARGKRSPKGRGRVAMLGLRVLRPRPSEMRMAQCCRRRSRASRARRLMRRPPAVVSRASPRRRGQRGMKACAAATCIHECRAACLGGR